MTLLLANSEMTGVIEVSTNLGRKPSCFSRSLTYMVMWVVFCLLITESISLCASPTPKKPNVLLISVDTLRADRVGVYGNQRGLTPNIDELAKGGVVAREFYTNAPWTRASFGTLMTSLYPSQHGAERNMQVGFNKSLVPKATTLAEVMKANGYKTAAFQSNGNAHKAYGFARGFDTWMGEDLIDEKEGLPYASMERNIEAFSRWFSKNRDTSYFVWINLMEPHMPYSPPQTWAKGIVDPDYKGQITNPFSNYRLARTGDLSKKDRAYIESLYDAQVRHADDGIGRLVKLLREAKQLDNTVVIVTSDHGEELWDHGRPGPRKSESEHEWGFGHGHTLFDELLRVPMVIRYPEVLGKRDRVTFIDETLQQLDFTPTLLDLVGARKPQRVEWGGVSVLSVLMGRERNYRSPEIFAESLLYGSELKAIRTGRFKLIYDMESGKTALYSLLDDPRELRDVSERYPRRVEMMKSRLFKWIKQVGGDPKQKPPLVTRGAEPTDDWLRKLGF